MRALGTIIDTTQREPTSDEIHCDLFDYHDHWKTIDPRLEHHHDPLSHVAESFAHDLVNLSVYAGQILHWLRPENIRSHPSVVVVGAVTEAFITVARSACDELAGALLYVATKEIGQKQRLGKNEIDNLPALREWARQKPNLVAEEIRPAFDYEFKWFSELTTLRNYLVHHGVVANIHCDGEQFNLWPQHPALGWITREPLLPLLAVTTKNVIDLGHHVAKFVQHRIPLPSDRQRTRMLQGVTIHSLHELMEVAPDYAKPSP